MTITPNREYKTYSVKTTENLNYISLPYCVQLKERTREFCNKKIKGYKRKGERKKSREEKATRFSNWMNSGLLWGPKHCGHIIDDAGRSKGCFAWFPHGEVGR